MLETGEGGRPGKKKFPLYQILFLKPYRLISLQDKEPFTDYPNELGACLAQFVFVSSYHGNLQSHTEQS